jgi:chaperonin GroES
VIAVGPGAPNKEGRVVPTSVKAGDRVLLPGWGGNAIKVGEDVRWFFFLIIFVSLVDWKR